MEISKDLRSRKFPSSIVLYLLELKINKKEDYKEAEQFGVTIRETLFRAATVSLTLPMEC